MPVPALVIPAVSACMELLPLRSWPSEWPGEWPGDRSLRAFKHECSEADTIP
jgi:hypothetical protein